MAGTVVKVSNEDIELKEDLKKLWSELRPEILSEILSHLSAGDFAIFRVICKSWHSVHHITRPLPSPIDFPNPQSPYLITLDDHKCNFFHPMYNKAYPVDIPELLGARIRFAKYGWLLLSRDDCSVFFFNPFTRTKIELPKYPYLDSFATMCFSCPPTSSDCFVIGIAYPWHKFGIIKRGEEFWTSHKYKRYFETSNCHPILYKGRCYCLGLEGNVGVFDPNGKYDPNGKECEWRIYPKPPLNDSLHRSFLVESNGKLLAVFVPKEEKNVCVMRLNLFKKVWRPVEKLSNKMLFVSQTASFLEEPTMVRGMDNKIYFPKVRDENCIFFSLSTKKYHSFFGNYSSSFPNTKQVSNNCAWIMPMITTSTKEEFQW